jgi:hypothetical protein
MPLTREYANSPIWACSCRAVPIWPTPTRTGWLRLVTCQLWTNAVTPCHPKPPPNEPHMCYKNPHTPPTFEFGVRRVLVSDPSQGTHLILALCPTSLTPTNPPNDLGFFFFGYAPSYAFCLLISWNLPISPLTEGLYG